MKLLNFILFFFFNFLMFKNKYLNFIPVCYLALAKKQKSLFMKQTSDQEISQRIEEK